MSERAIKDLDSVIEGIESGAFIEDADDELAQENFWSYVPWGDDFQIGFHKSTANIRGNFSANRVGKTLSSIMEIFISATGRVPDSMKEWYPEEKLAPPNSNFFMATLTDDLYDEIFLPLIREWIPLKSFGIKYLPSKKRFDCPNGVTIFLKSYASGWAKFQGSNIWMIMLDEEPDDKRIYKECLTRILSSHGYVWFSMTPLKGFTWVYRDLFRKAETDSSIEVFNGNMYQSPYLTKEYVDKWLKQFPPHEQEARAMGKFISTVEKHVFNIDNVNKWIENSMSPIHLRRLGTIGKMSDTIRDLNLIPEVLDADAEFVSYSPEEKHINPNAIWQIWEEPIKGVGYLCSVDVSSGQGELPDHSVAHVKRQPPNGKPIHVATVRTNCIRPYDFGKIVFAGCLYYNLAMIAVEAMTYGDALINSIRWYPYIWFSNTYEGKGKCNGFLMTPTRRVGVIEVERNLVDSNCRLIMLERETLNEMMVFHYNKVGKADHPADYRSDGIMASCIGDGILDRYSFYIRDNSKMKNPDANMERFRYLFKDDDPQQKAKLNNRNKFLGKSRTKRIGRFS